MNTDPNFTDPLILEAIGNIADNSEHMERILAAPLDAEVDQVLRLAFSYSPVLGTLTWNGEPLRRPADPPAWYTVQVYLIDQGYGGPEEGGWYYDTGHVSLEHLEHARKFTDEGAAYDYSAHLNDTLGARWNEGRRPISSVLSTGQYRALVFPNDPPRAFPETRPHFE